MKICWDTLEKIEYVVVKDVWAKRGKDGYVHHVYKYFNSCLQCNQPFLGVVGKGREPEYCTRECSSISKKVVEKRNLKMRSIFQSKEYRKNISCSMKAHFKKNPREPHKSSNWKGGITKMGVAGYDTYNPKIYLSEKTRQDPNNKNILQAVCNYCGQWFTPSSNSVQHRVFCLNNVGMGEGRLYCSDECKEECSIFGQFKYPKSYKISTSREVAPVFRQMVFDRDGWECQKCGATKQLHCHHIEGYTQNKMLANDIDNGITFCKKCHESIHSNQIGCRNIDLRCSKMKG